MGKSATSKAKTSKGYSYRNILTIWVLVLSVTVYFKVIKPLFNVPQTPQLPNTWWGPGDPNKEDTSIKPFKINVSNDIIKDLKHRLETAIPFQEPLEGVQQHYGINANHLKSIVDFWKTKYNWREREKFLNQFPQYKTSIQGLQIHYLHVKPTKTEGLRVLPLLLVHGWPGSVREFYEIIPLLTTPQRGADFVFEVIAPSLPGYGFSDAAVRTGLGPIQMSTIFKNLMLRLGHEKFYAQGGDWGSAIIAALSIIYPKNVIAMHSNFCTGNLFSLKLFAGSFYPSLFMSEEEAEKIYPLSKTYSYLILEFGYMHLQATKPDTVGFALRDSPVGLAAYILEKFTTWTNPEWKDLEDGGLTKKFPLTNLLDNVMIYWVTRSVTTSLRIYAESFSKESRDLELDKIPIEVPSGCARFKHEILYMPQMLLKEKYQNLVHLSDHDDGGHFAAFEVPEVLAADFYVFAQKVEAQLKTKKES